MAHDYAPTRPNNCITINKLKNIYIYFVDHGYNEIHDFPINEEREREAPKDLTY